MIQPRVRAVTWEPDDSCRCLPRLGPHPVVGERRPRHPRAGVGGIVNARTRRTARTGRTVQAGLVGCGVSRVSRRSFVAALPLLPAAVAACGDSGRDLGTLVSTTTTASTSTLSTEATPSTPSVPTTVVEISTASGFTPKDTTAPAGTQLQFKAAAGETHTILADAGAAMPFLARLTPQAPTSIVGVLPVGTTTFHCELHQSETGSITIA